VICALNSTFSARAPSKSQAPNREIVKRSSRNDWRSWHTWFLQHHGDSIVATRSLPSYGPSFLNRAHVMRCVRQFTDFAARSAANFSSAAAKERSL
jgi:hypothetical protein